MTKKQTIAPETVRSDYALVQVTLTLAVETFFCDDNSDLIFDSTMQTVLNRLTDASSKYEEVVVLHSDFTPLTLSKGAQS